MNSADFGSLVDVNYSEALLRPKPESGRELQELISPVSCEEFVNSYFSRKSLTLEGAAEKFAEIFSWERLKIALARGQKITDRRYNLKASFTSGEKSGSSRPVIDAYYDQVGELLQAGATICVTNIHMADPILARWAQAIRAQLNFTGTVGVNCYISPDGSGLPMHYDKRVATSLQISGKKLWRFSTESAKPWPPHNARYVQGHVEPTGVNPGRLPPEMQFEEVELSPGDLLCIPAGAWHSARAVGDCMALNLYFSPRNFLDQIMPLIQNLAYTDENWRAGTPATIEKIQGNMPEEVETYTRERLDEFKKMVMEVFSDPQAVSVPWLNSLTLNPYTGWQPAPKPLPRPKKADQQFRVTTTSIRFAQVKDQLILASENGILSLPTNFAPILQNLSTQRGVFTLNDVLAWRASPDEPSPSEIVNHFPALIENRILELVG